MTTGVVVRLERPEPAALASLLTADLPPHARLLVARDGATQQPIGVLALTPGPTTSPSCSPSKWPRSRGGAESPAGSSPPRSPTRACSASARSASACGRGGGGPRAARALGFTEIDGFGAHVGDDSGVCFARSVR
ncbi:hypothetical protein C1I64_19950 [Rathayibacter festucae DSM 15932]|uniref:Uncharacterized protein n=1 Tax=Rathayibacter festucae DSM 15932 TaxID=1328866 RepID=A0A3Q9V305_9MICO|nr:hypothetical protein C1I64_19950 [Rathayibacter festucae DSM 15932]